MNSQKLLSSYSLGESGIIDGVWIQSTKKFHVPKISETCFHGYSHHPEIQIPNNAVVLCFIHNLPDLMQHATNHPNNNFIIVCREGDPSLTPNIVNSKPQNVKHIFSINVTLNHPHVTPMPMAFHIGSDCLEVDAFAEKTDRVIENEVLAIFSTIGYRERPDHDRNRCLNHLRGKSWATLPLPLQNGEWVNAPIPHRLYLDALFKHRYLACPMGYGVERIAYWEAMVLGAIPICLKYPELLHFSDMPFAFIDTWEQVTPEWCEQNKGIANNRNLEKLTVQYWVNQIQEAKNRLF